MNFIEKQLSDLTTFLDSNHITYIVEKAARTKTIYVKIGLLKIRISDHPDAYYRSVKQKVIYIQPQLDLSNPCYPSAKKLIEHIKTTKVYRVKGATTYK